MKTKTIKAILRTNFDKFIVSITDDKVKNLVAKNSIITGGSIASMLLGDKPNDIDIYFKTKETVKAVAEYYIKMFNVTPGISRSVELIEENDEIIIKVQSDGIAKVISPEKGLFKPIFITDNAISLSGKFQLMLRFYGEVDEVHKNFDFAHCTNYWESDSGKLTLREKALTSLLTKELFYEGSRYPICSIIRTRKFIARGFTINAGQYLKMCFQVSNLDLTNVKVLREQLIGVDSAYFNLLIEALANKQEKDPNFVINDAYIATIIDKIF